ncbi:MAG: acyl-CoA/acyl-ACP dehydrogenase [Acidobacteriia bacterium]|nr:acyl-CoA/acyl-ACP dehydrogenase [Terriglobia bacterium]
MQFGLTETEQMLQHTARSFFTSECPIAEVRRLMEIDGAYDEELWRKIVEHGWTGIIFDEESGGMGLGLVEMAVAAEEMGRALLPGPYFSTVFVAGALLNALPQGGNGLKAICEGRARATLALLEENACWETGGVGMELRNGRLSGTKLLVPDAATADLLLCVARSSHKVVVAQVCSSARGVSIRRMPSIDRTRQLYSVAFDEAPAEVLARGDQAQAALDRAMDVATVALVAEMVGGMQRILELSVEYAKTRKQFGKAIGQFQSVQHQCADMLLLTESSRSAAYYAAWALNQGAADARTAVSVAKAYASEAYRDVGNRGIQVHGGMGFTWENDIHLYYRRAKASEIAFGDAAFHRERIARTVVDGRAGFSLPTPVNQEAAGGASRNM